jgi:hypothetical protein
MWKNCRLGAGLLRRMVAAHEFVRSSEAGLTAAAGPWMA